MKAEDAVAEIENGCLKYLLPEDCHDRADKWSKIKSNIINNSRITGSGYGYSLLHAVAKYGDEAAVKFLLENGANVNAVDAKGNTALHMAAKGRGQNRDKIIQILLYNHADPSLKRKNGKTALMIAIIKCQAESIPLLAEASRNLDTQDILNYSALHYAAYHGNVSAVSVLLEFKANVDCIGEDGRTPLHYAVAGSKCTLELIQLLLDYEANAKIKDDKGQTACDLAKKKYLDHSIVITLQKSKLTKKWSLLSGATLVERKSSQRFGFSGKLAV
jgi:ankyrin repeat protein